MKKLLVQEFLEKNTFKKLEADHGVEVSFSKDGTKFSLNYSMISSKEDDPLANQCRGLLLSTIDGRSLNDEATLNSMKKLNFDSVCPGETKIVSYGFDRFLNYGQGFAADINWQDPELKVQKKLDGCFTYDTTIKCWDGSSFKIGHVVKNKLKLTLIGRDKDGNVVPCKITNWHDNGTKDNWLEITTSVKFKNKNKKFLITDNHHIFINDKFETVSNAKNGDTICLYEEILSNELIHFIESSMLGDGTISKDTKNYKFSEGHKIEHESYVYYIKDCLGELYSRVGDYTSGFGSSMKRLNSSANKSITELRKKWYINGVKKIPNNLNWIDDFTVAKWYMDDGSLAHDSAQKDRALFATNGFSEKEVRRLGAHLEKMYGVYTTTYFSKGWCLRVNSGKNNTIDKMWLAISKHIHPVMRYKLPSKYRNGIFEAYPKGRLEWQEIKEKIVDIKRIEVNKNLNNKYLFPNGRKGYDISTTTENYVANGILVHNSMAQLYHDPFQKSWHVATRSCPEADIPIDGTSYTFRSLFEEGLRTSCNKISFEDFTANLNKKYTYVFEITSYYNRIVCLYKKTEITILAARNLENLKEIRLDLIKINVPKVECFNLKSIEDTLQWVSYQKPTEHEGVVIVDGKFNRIKVKNPSYVLAHRAKDNFLRSDRSCLEAILLGQEDDLIPLLPQPMIDKIHIYKSKLNSFIKKYDDIYQETIKSLPADATQKDFALKISSQKIWHPPLFNIYSGKCKDMNQFIQMHKKDGTWHSSFLDKLIVYIEV